jgi:hypothetical protein
VNENQRSGGRLKSSYFLEFKSIKAHKRQVLNQAEKKFGKGQQGSQVLEEESCI